MTFKDDLTITMCRARQEQQDALCDLAEKKIASLKESCDLAAQIGRSLASMGVNTTGLPMAQQHLLVDIIRGKFHALGLLVTAARGTGRAGASIVFTVSGW